MEFQKTGEIQENSDEGKSKKMELQLKPISEQDPWYGEAQRLYETSFPPNERRTFPELFDDFHGACEIMSAMEGNRFIGMTVLLTYKDITHILYIAIEENLRSRGYGSRMLDLIRKQYPDQKIIADLERPEEDAQNEPQRESRVAFYRKNGYSFTGIDYRWEGEDYCIMSNGGNLSHDAFQNFWGHFYPRQNVS